MKIWSKKQYNQLKDNNLKFFKGEYNKIASSYMFTIKISNKNGKRMLNMRLPQNTENVPLRMIIRRSYPQFILYRLILARNVDSCIDNERAACDLFQLANRSALTISARSNCSTWLNRDTVCESLSF